MLGRYKIYRGKRPEGHAWPDGIRQDARKHTRHCLRPGTEMVEDYLRDPSDPGWKRFAAAYCQLVENRFAEDQTPFDKLAQLSRDDNVFLGCSCPTKKNPDAQRCHTALALQFILSKYPDTKIDVSLSQ